MRSAEELTELLHDIDGRGYKAYKAIGGRWDLGDFVLSVDHVQGDPFASPSRVSAHLAAEVAALPPSLLSSPARRTGVAACLARAFAAAAREASSHLGSGKSGVVVMEDPGQLVIPQTAVRVDADGCVEARFRVGLPARGRRVLGHKAATLLGRTVAALVRDTLPAPVHDPESLRHAAEVNEDADALRASLRDRDLVGFVAEGARLPRRSGVDDRPLEGPSVVSFEAPQSLRVGLETPNSGLVTGMGIPRGVTLIVGGGFHGKSTLLRALERGVYNHAPGDGRERVVADAASVKVRAEDGRSVAGVDISGFIDGLPGGEDTHRFTTPNASGSTSQAAGLVEALEAGARVLLVDEDTAATNFMIRDRRMQALVPAEAEPITPFVDRIRELADGEGVSSVLVLGGSGDYLDVAETVILMRDYRPHDATSAARRVAEEHPTGRRHEARAPLAPRPRRVPLPASVDPSRGRRDVSVKVRDPDEILFGDETLDLTAVEQLVSWSQARAVSEALVLARRELMDGRRSLPDILDGVMARVEAEGLDVLDRRRPGDLAAFRRFELAAALNRLRTLEVTSS